MARSDYINADGSPRYGIRTTAVQHRQPRPTVNVNAVGLELASMPLIALDLAAKVRRRRPWSVGPHELTHELLAEYPEQAVEAEAIVADHIGPGKKWARRLALEDIKLSHPTREQAAAGLKNALSAVAIAISPMLAVMVLFALEPSVPVLLFLGLAAVALAAKASREFEDRKRMPVNLTLGAKDRADFLIDARTATLVALLESRGTVLPPAKAAAARAGFKDMQAAADAVKALDIPTSMDAMEW